MLIFKKDTKMSFEDLFDSGAHRKNLGHFASIVQIAKADSEISEDEVVLLKRFARRLNIDTSDYEEVLSGAKKYPINPPVGKERRLERIFDLLKMVYLDGEMDEFEQGLIMKYGIGLGFTSEQSNEIVSKADGLYRAQNNMELESLLEALSF